MSIKINETFFEEIKKVSTPNLDKIDDVWNYFDADDELGEIAKFIKKRTEHNADIEVERIKFLYANKPKKDGGRFVCGSLILRNELDKMVNDDYDYIAIVYYKAWKDLDMKNKIIQLDKILCGVEMAQGKDMAEINYKKKQADSKEYLSNMHFFGPDETLKSSEVVDLAIQRIMEQEAEDKKLKRTVKSINQ